MLDVCGFEVPFEPSVAVIAEVCIDISLRFAVEVFQFTATGVHPVNALAFKNLHCALPMPFIVVSKRGIDNIASDDNEVGLLLVKELLDECVGISEVLGIAINPDVTQLDDAERAIFVEAQMVRVLVDWLFLHHFDLLFFLVNLLWLILRVWVFEHIASSLLFLWVFFGANEWLLAVFGDEVARLDA